MIKAEKDCLIPSSLVPKCPICGEDMEPNLRKDDTFIQDDNWYKMDSNYEKFMEKIKGHKIVLLELGVGYNTPGIIRYPFEQLTYTENECILIRMNKDYPAGIKENRDKTISFQEDIMKVIKDLQKEE